MLTQLIKRAVVVLAVGTAIVGSGTSPLQAQIVRGQLVDSLTGAPIERGSVLLLAEDGGEIGQTLTDSEGLFLIRAGEAGRYRLRVTMSGYRESEFPPFDLATGQMLGYQLLMAPSEAIASSPLATDTSADLDALVSQICEGALEPGMPVLVGLVRHAATGQPIPAANVVLTWPVVPEEFLAGMPPEFAGGAATTGGSGFYAVCGAPVGTTVVMHAESGGAMSQLITLNFRNDGVLADGVFEPMVGQIFRQDISVMPLSEWTTALSGTVTDSGGNPLSGAAIAIVGTRFSTRSNLFGQFEFSPLPPGRIRLTADAIGYRQTHTELTLNPNDSIELPPGTLRMSLAPRQLPPITVEAERPDSRRNLAEFEKRRTTTTGEFLTREEFMRQGSVQSTIDVLRRIRGLRVRPGTGLTFPWLITSGRSAGRGGFSEEFNGQCFPLVFLDRLHLGTTRTVVVDRAIPVESLEAVEFYQGSAGMPPEFNRPGSVCGVLVFWSR